MRGSTHRLCHPYAGCHNALYTVPRYHDKYLNAGGIPNGSNGALALWARFPLMPGGHTRTRYVCRVIHARSGARMLSQGSNRSSRSAVWHPAIRGAEFRYSGHVHSAESRKFLERSAGYQRAASRGSIGQIGGYSLWSERDCSRLAFLLGARALSRAGSLGMHPHAIPLDHGLHPLHGKQTIMWMFPTSARSPRTHASRRVLRAALRWLAPVLLRHPIDHGRASSLVRLEDGLPLRAWDNRQL